MGVELGSLTLSEEHRLYSRTGAEKNIWTYDGGSGRSMKKTA
jgi:hypothetical protein